MRKIKFKKRIYKKDYKYNSKLVTYFVNNLMRDGKKNLAYKIFYNALNIINNKIKDINPLIIFKKSLKNIAPKKIIKNKKIGGTNYNIPIEINKRKKIYLSIKWLILYAKKRKEKTMSDKLANEIIAAYNGIGEAIKKRNNIYKLAESNKAFKNINI
ncbi:30S ribosomal protein S7 [Candidatus Shikimatogenerans bostrichidophilus]|uniref:30S ribosomal protein S7 n=1 Tax=Candidatus Shikimatogenerans bostrichidophilus TaxID=2943807 RepID=UPI0029666388